MKVAKRACSKGEHDATTRKPPSQRVKIDGIGNYPLYSTTKRQARKVKI